MTTASDSISLPFVSIITTFHNNSKMVKQLIRALKNQSYPRTSFEIIVVSNRSTEDLSSLSAIPDIKLVFENSVASSYSARNRGIRAAAGDIFCFIDSDCTPDRDWLVHGIKTLEHSGAQLVGGQIVFGLSIQRTAAEYYDSITNMQTRRNIEKRGVTTTANLFITREVIEEIGFFPENLRSGADIYYTALAVRKGFNLAYCPEALVHHPARTFRQLMKKARRVGAGKRDILNLIEILPAEKKIPRDRIRGRHPLDHLNAARIWKNLKVNGHKISILKFLGILGVSYCYISIQFLSEKFAKVK